MKTKEQIRLDEQDDKIKHWKKWGPYLSERQWGTVREDYSPYGSAWDYFPHDHARSRAYRWGEDGIGGISDDQQKLCFAFAFWNGKDQILKERLFGVNAEEGNHGEDVKELYYYLDSTPTHSYMKMLYKYPLSAYPYEKLLRENAARDASHPEYEIWDTGVFKDKQYADALIEYAKASENDILIKITLTNHSQETADLHILPTLWFRNTWSWGDKEKRPVMTTTGNAIVISEHPEFNSFKLYYEEGDPLFTENETNTQRMFGLDSPSGIYFKDAFHRYIIEQEEDAINPLQLGSKACVIQHIQLQAGERKTLRLRLTSSAPQNPFADFDQLFSDRLKDADEFYGELQKCLKNTDLKNIQRQAWAGMMWSKQYYNFNVYRWLNGDPGHPTPPSTRNRNEHWQHLHHEDIISMPDKWEYPWYAAWDLAFHCIPIMRIDPAFAKHQLLLLLSERSQHPNGQLPAYEWAFGDVNPPVHAWAVLRVFNADKRIRGDHGDLIFLEQAFHKLMLNFTWWVNQKDTGGNNIFEGGFLGLDNIGVFDRGAPLPEGNRTEQADGTAWMAMYSLNMLRIAMELATHNPAYKPMITKYIEHFIYISAALNNIGNVYGLWDKEDGFYYDILHWPDGKVEKLKVRSMVGLIPLFAVETFTKEMLEALPDIREKIAEFFTLRPDLARMMNTGDQVGQNGRQMISIMHKGRLTMVLKRMLDETEFLSPYGIRALSKYHEKNPYHLNFNGRLFQLTYLPGESNFNEWGKNSNWRGPIWFPMNYMILVSLIRYDQFYGDSLKIEYPTGSGRQLTLKEIAKEIGRRLGGIFQRDASGNRAVYENTPWMQTDPEFSDHILFYEYFHGDTGRGVGASHQTGWTGLIAEIIFQSSM